MVYGYKWSIGCRTARHDKTTNSKWWLKRWTSCPSICGNETISVERRKALLNLGWILPCRNTSTCCFHHTYWLLWSIKNQSSRLQFRLFHILFSIQFCLPSLTKLLSRQWYSSCSFDVTFDVFVSDMTRCITKTFVLLTHPRSSCTRSHLRHWQSHLKRDFDLTWSKEKIDGLRRCRFPKINRLGWNGDTRSNPVGFDPQIGGI